MIPEMTRKMAAFGRNGWQVSPGISGRFEPEWVAGLGQNMHQLNEWQRLHHHFQSEYQ